MRLSISVRLAVQLSHTSDITGRESSFERERNALRERQMETILEPGETPLRNAEGHVSDRRGLFARSADGGMSVLATPRREPGGGADKAGSPSSARSKEWLAGLGTPCSASCASPAVSLPDSGRLAQCNQKGACNHACIRLQLSCQPSNLWQMHLSQYFWQSPEYVGFLLPS